MNNVTGICTLAGSTEGFLPLPGQSDEKKNNVRGIIPRNVFSSSHPFLIIPVIFERVILSPNSFPLNMEIIMGVDIFNLLWCKLKLDASLIHVLSLNAFTDLFFFKIKNKVPTTYDKNVAGLG